MKVAICTPHTGLIRAKCAQAVNELVARTLATRITYNGSITQAQFAFFYEEAGPLEYRRTQLALKALEWGCDYLLLIDWDHTFPPDALLRLAAHDKPFVAANYLGRHRQVPVAFASQDSVVAGRGLQSVVAIGLGFALIKSEVFNATPKPWFRSEIGDDGKLVCGEDVHFCNQVRSAGIPVFVDHDIPVGHIAETVLTLHGEDDNASAIRPVSGHL